MLGLGGGGGAGVGLRAVAAAWCAPAAAAARRRRAAFVPSIRLVAPVRRSGAASASSSSSSDHQNTAAAADAAATTTTTTTTTEQPPPLREEEGEAGRRRRREPYNPPPDRLPRADLSLDVRTIAAHLDVVLSHLHSRLASADTVAAAHAVADAAAVRVALLQRRDAALNARREQSAVVGQWLQRQRRNEQQQPPPHKDEGSIDASSEIGGDGDGGTPPPPAAMAAAVAASNEAAAAAEAAERELAVVQDEMDRHLAILPNLLDDRVPAGRDASANVVVHAWGDVRAVPAAVKAAWPVDFAPKWHDDVASGLDGYSAAAAVLMSGTRFVALRGAVSRLERALASYMVDAHADMHGYTEVSVPVVVSRAALEGTGQLPKFEEDLFRIAADSHTCHGQDAFLIPTAEVPVTNLHRDQVLEEDDLPLSYVACTPCFRAEAGSSGRDTRGLIRTHQFHKVELVKITTPATSDAEHELLTGHAEAILRALELPYRKVRLCAGDIGFAAQHCYDLEVWLPGPAEYREISSCSNTGDFQARRLALRYRPKAAVLDPTATGDATKKKNSTKKSKPVLCHTINGSGLAVGRTLVAVLENYQRPDGSVVIPVVLRPYMGGKEVIEPPHKGPTQ